MKRQKTEKNDGVSFWRKRRQLKIPRFANFQVIRVSQQQQNVNSLLLSLLLFQQNRGL